MVCSSPLEVGRSPWPRKVVEWGGDWRRFRATRVPQEPEKWLTHPGEIEQGAHSTLHCDREDEVCAPGTTVPAGGRSLP